LALVLLLGAGLLVRSFANLLLVAKGFDSEHLLSFSLSLPRSPEIDGPSQQRFFTAVLARLRSIPGVEGVALVNDLPLSGGGVSGAVTIEGREQREAAPESEKRIVSTDYFRVMGIQVLAGRTFSEHDNEDSPAVIVVSDSFARLMFPGESALGKRIGFSWDMDGLQEVIGVVGDVRHYDLALPPEPTTYVSYRQRPHLFFSILVKSSVEPAPLLAAIRQQVRSIDAGRPIVHPQTIEAVVSEAVAGRRLSLLLVSGFSFLGLVLAATGIYGVLSYLVRQRTRELGIRVACGATRGDVMAAVVREGFRLIGAGTVVGLIVSLPLARLIESQLFGVPPLDPVTMSAVSILLLLVGLLACALPARRAASSDPVEALRVE
jgi:predicted permease